MKRLATTLFLFVALSTGVLAQAPTGFVVTKEPTLNGMRCTADLPASQHHRNVGGSDGAGLCVYTSFWHAAIWQSVADVYEFRAYMERRPGGSYPEKFDSTLAAYCKSKNVPLPGYVQHTGGDVEFLKLALKTGRMVCVTYCGVDGAGRYGGEVIAHMINLVYLDDQTACVLDNNFPGTFLWMPAKDFIARWTGIGTNGRPYRIRGSAIGGGWAIVLLAGPPAPYRVPPTQEIGADGEPSILFGQCVNGRCQVSQCGPEPVGHAPSESHEWGLIPGVGYGWRLKALFAPAKVEKPMEVAIAPEPVAVGGGGQVDPFPGGVIHDKIDQTESYRCSGEPCTKVQAYAALLSANSLTDDSTRWNLAVVGDAGFIARVQSDVMRLGTELRSKLHIHTYAPSEWPVGQFNLLPGVTLRKPAVGRIGADSGVIDPVSYSPAKLDALLGPVNGVVPQPAPGPTPDPKKPDDKPKDDPPKDPPAPPAPDKTGLALAMAALAALLAWIFRR